MFPRDKIAPVETTEIGDKQYINGREQRVEKLTCVYIYIYIYIHIHTHTHTHTHTEKMDFYQRDKFSSMGKV